MRKIKVRLKKDVKGMYDMLFKKGSIVEAYQQLTFDPYIEQGIGQHTGLKPDEYEVVEVIKDHKPSFKSISSIPRSSIPSYATNGSVGRIVEVKEGEWERFDD